MDEVSQNVNERGVPEYEYTRCPRMWMNEVSQKWMDNESQNMDRSWPRCLRIGWTNILKTLYTMFTDDALLAVFCILKHPVITVYWWWATGSFMYYETPCIHCLLMMSYWQFYVFWNTLYSLSTDDELLAVLCIMKHPVFTVYWWWATGSFMYSETPCIHCLLMMSSWQSATNQCIYFKLGAEIVKLQVDR